MFSKFSLPLALLFVALTTATAAAQVTFIEGDTEVVWITDGDESYQVEMDNEIVFLNDKDETVAIYNGDGIVYVEGKDNEVVYLNEGDDTLYISEGNDVVLVDDDDDVVYIGKSEVVFIQADTATPTRTPTPAPTWTPTSLPTVAPTWTPTTLPTAAPTWTPSPKPTSTSTPSPTRTPSPTPTATATVTPSPTWTPTATQSPMPTATDTATPVTPTPEPAALREPVAINCEIDDKLTATGEKIVVVGIGQPGWEVELRINGFVKDMESSQVQVVTVSPDGKFRREFHAEWFGTVTVFCRYLNIQDGQEIPPDWINNTDGEINFDFPDIVPEESDLSNNVGWRARIGLIPFYFAMSGGFILVLMLIVLFFRYEIGDGLLRRGSTLALRWPWRTLRPRRGTIRP